MKKSALMLGILIITMTLSGCLANPEKAEINQALDTLEQAVATQYYPQIRMALAPVVYVQLFWKENGVPRSSSGVLSREDMATWYYRSNLTAFKIANRKISVKSGIATVTAVEKYTLWSGGAYSSNVEAQYTMEKISGRWMITQMKLSE